MKLLYTLGFLALCLWSSLEWLTADWLPGRMAPLAGVGLHVLLIGLGGALMGGRSALRHWKIALIGLVLVGAPLLIMYEARGLVSGGLGVIAFALVPIGVMIVEGDLGSLQWGLAGAAGLLLILPPALPSTGRGWVGACLVVVAAGLTAFGLARMHSLLRGVQLAVAVGAMCLPSGAVLLLAGMLEGRVGWGRGTVGVEVVRALLLDLPQVVLLVWLLREVTALRVSARYLVAPLLTVMEGWALVREGIGARMLVGSALLVAGAFGLLREDAGRMETGLGLRSSTL